MLQKGRPIRRKACLSFFGEADVSRQAFFGDNRWRVVVNIRLEISFIVDLGC
ncbi:MAG: hypothetical protein JSW35_05510 [Deltaproteobacteria bacterium]|nr:MAG: hypothetical protein JSW35_05510 [Deltaproteobacteria bacterium]